MYSYASRLRPEHVKTISTFRISWAVLCCVAFVPAPGLVYSYQIPFSAVFIGVKISTIGYAAANDHHRASVRTCLVLVIVVFLLQSRTCIEPCAELKGHARHCYRSQPFTFGKTKLQISISLWYAGDST